MGEPSNQVPDLTLRNYTVRLSDPMRERVERAAEVESLRRGQRIDGATLFRDLGLQAIESLLAQRGREASKPTPRNA